MDGEKMAGTDASPEMETVHYDREDRLKYLDFVQIAAARTVGFLSNVYGYAKENSGPLKPGVQTVEGRIKTVVSPVYEKLHDVPIEILKFADRKVDGLVQEVERRVPAAVKATSNQALSAAQKAPVIARAVASEVQRVPGLVREASNQALSAAQQAPVMARTVASEVQPARVMEAATGIAKTAYGCLEPTAKELYARYEPVAEQYAMVAWQSLNSLPLVPEMAHAMVPMAAYCSDKYNRAVSYTEEKGYSVSAYFPLVPTVRIAKAYDGMDAEESSHMPDAPPTYAEATAGTDSSPEAAACTE